MFFKKIEVSAPQQTIINFPAGEPLPPGDQRLSNRLTMQRLMAEHPQAFAIFHDEGKEPVILLNPDNPHDSQSNFGVAITQHGVAIWTREPKIGGGGYDRSRIEEPRSDAATTGHDLWAHNVSGAIKGVFEAGNTFDLTSVGNTSFSVHTDVSAQLQKNNVFTQSIPAVMYKKT